jgi:uncharacterized protein
MRCPACPDQVLTMSERKGVEIDYCPSCRGVWLDRGELDKIVEKASAEFASVQAAPAPPSPSQFQSPQPQSAQYAPQQPQHQQRYEEQKPYEKKRKKNFFEDLFD